MIYKVRTPVGLVVRWDEEITPMPRCVGYIVGYEGTSNECSNEKRL